MDKLGTYIIIDSIFYVAFEDFVRGGGIVISTGSWVGVCRSKNEGSASSRGATPSSIKTINFVRGTTILFDVLVFTILIGKAPQKRFTGHTTSDVWNAVFTYLGFWKLEWDVNS